MFFNGICFLNETYNGLFFFKFCVENLVCGCDGNGFSFGVIKLVHCANIHDHGKAPGEDEQEQEGDKESRPDRGGEELHSVDCRGKGF